MADKEERIIITVAEPSLLEGGADKIYPCMTRQEAIEVMAKAIFNKCYEYTYKWEVANEETKTAFRLYAREALNALLEGVKK